MLISFDILLEWREHFKLGHPISNVIMAKLTFLNQKLEQVHFATVLIYSQAKKKQSDLIFLIIIQMVLRFFLFLRLPTLSFFFKVS